MNYQKNKKILSAAGWGNLHGIAHLVAAADGRTRALGTRFIVERLDARTQVTGVFHQVEVSLDHL
ncbi:MAG: hypothetical protein RRY35_01500, partial [Clostridiales bacterium]